MAEAGSSLDQAALRTWLDDQFGGVETIAVAPIVGGGSCEMFSLWRAGEHMVMRRAPRAAVSSTAHNVIREFNILQAMQCGQARIPTVYFSCEDTRVAGAPFYLMEYIDGEVIRRKLPKAYVNAPKSQLAIGEELIDALVELHAFDWRGTYLAEIGKPDNYLGRQVARWLGQYSEYKCRDLPAIDSVASWLAKYLPTRGELTVMHGDYKLDNVIMSKTLPPRILRVIDFEMTSVGDPLIDLAWAMIFWPEPGNALAIAAPGSSEQGMHADYCQSPDSLVARYSAKTGRDMASFQWYQAFAAWKLAIVLEGSYAKFLAGASNKASHEFFGFVVDQLLLRAQRFAQ